jgi:hypothetical protein
MLLIVVALLPSIPISPVSHDHVVGHLFYRSMSHNNGVHIVKVVVKHVVDIFFVYVVDAGEGLRDRYSPVDGQNLLGDVSRSGGNGILGSQDFVFKLKTKVSL